MKTHQDIPIWELHKVRQVATAVICYVEGYGCGARLLRNGDFRQRCSFRGEEAGSMATQKRAGGTRGERVAPTRCTRRRNAMIDEAALREVIQRYTHTRGDVRYVVSLWRVETHPDNPMVPTDGVRLHLSFVAIGGGAAHQLVLKGPASELDDHPRLLYRIALNIDKILDGDLQPGWTAPD